MDSQITTALLTVGSTAVGGSIGYLLHEYRNRVQPFIAITKVKGDFWNYNADVDVPEDVLVAIKTSFYINKLSSTDKLSEIHESWENAYDVSEYGSELIRLADDVIASKQPEDLLTILPKILSNSLYERLIIFLLAKDILKPNPADVKLPMIVPTYTSTQYEGCIELAFPGSPVRFGERFDNLPIVKNKCQSFIDLIEKLDMKGLKEAFREIKRNIQSEILIAKDVEPLLSKNLLDENSTWIIEVYLANLGQNPFLVDKKATLHVYDEMTGAKYNEPCKLLLIHKDDKGKISRNAAESPLVIGKEKDAMFGFVTENVQGKMTRGDAFRDAFNKKNAQCWLEFEVETVSLFSRLKKLKTPKTPFHAPT
ncbi:MAG: hypothetical protein WCE94_02520 [Candidatus Methanoperedens sp.]